MLAIQIHPNFLEFVRPSPHSTYSPSAADRWLRSGCSASIRLSAGIPEETSEYSEEGTFAHSVCEAVFRQLFYFVPFPEELKNRIIMWELKDPKRHGAFEEMLEHAHQYVAVIEHYLTSGVLGDILHVWIEKGVPIYPEKGCFGTGDCIIIGTRGAAVIDFKYGRGKNVSARSLQLKVYAAGVRRYMQVPADYRFHAVVYQPRTDIAPKTHEYSVAELDEFLQEIWLSILACEDANAKPCEGNHCYWCPAKRTRDPKFKCPLFKEKAVTLANERFDQFFADMNAPVESLKPEHTSKRDQALIKLIALFPMIKDAVEAGKEEFLFRLQGGEAIPGVRIIEEPGNRRFNAEKPEDVESLVASHFPNFSVWKEVPATRKLKTITEIEKELGKNKLDPICVRKVAKKVDILDDKTNAILGEMAAYARMINNGHGQEE